MGELIKTTARFQEEPMRQKPLLQIDRTLPNTVRASIDSGGRDNPFKPDGHIYKSADPIVDYYKFGPNQSRAQTPTDGQLLLDGRKKAGKGEKRPCWQRWFCCCCCCFRCCNSSNKGQEGKGKKTINQQQPQKQLEQPTIVVVSSSRYDHNNDATLEIVPSGARSEIAVDLKTSAKGKSDSANKTTEKKSGKCIVS